MLLKEFHYDLPEDRIAQVPLEKRDASKLLILDKDTWKIQDNIFSEIVNHLWEDDVLVLNKTRVIKARLNWEVTLKKSWIRKVEVFLHREISENTWDCMVYPGKRFKKWVIISFYNGGNTLVMTWEVIDFSETARIIKFTPLYKDLFSTLEEVWETPLPPYIQEKLDNSERYQTIYNKNAGSIAAPTAGLHFTEKLLQWLRDKWVQIEKVLLHVWIGTFATFREEKVEEHKMHSEHIELEDNTADRLNRYKSEWKRIIAVWTTSIRVLESFSDDNWVLLSWKKETDIFIYPWYKWKFVSSMITNFHLPESTLLMLVSSLAGQENIKKAYSHAIDEKYRFFSFWDAMWIR